MGIFNRIKSAVTASPTEDQDSRTDTTEPAVCPTPQASGSSPSGAEQQATPPTQRHGSPLRAKNASPTRRANGSQIARSHEIEILAALHRFGWLRVQDIARLLWPNAREPLDMAYRVLKRMAERKLILVRKTSHGRIFVLALGGTSRLRDEAGIHAKSGKDLEPGNFQHRSIANMYSIERMLDPDGWDVFTEFEIQAHRAPVFAVNKKVADVLEIAEGACAWIECENTRKRTDDVHKLLEFTLDGLSRPLWVADDIKLVEVRFVYVNPAPAVRLLKRLVSRVEREPHRPWSEIGLAVEFVGLQLAPSGLCIGRKVTPLHNYIQGRI